MKFINPDMRYVIDNLLVIGNNHVNLKEVNFLSKRRCECECAHGVIIGIKKGAVLTNMLGCPLVLKDPKDLPDIDMYPGTRYVIWFDNDEIRDEAFDEILEHAPHLKLIKERRFRTEYSTVES